MKRLHSLAAFALVAPVMTIGAGSAMAQSDPTANDSVQRQEQRTLTEQAQQDRMTAQKAKERAKAQGTYLATKPATAFLSEEVIGKDLRSGPDDKSLGTINDLLIDGDGHVVAVIIEVGGFMGMGAKDIAIAWDSIEHSQNEEGDGHIFTADATKDSMISAPAYSNESSEQQGAEQQTTGARAQEQQKSTSHPRADAQPGMKDSEHRRAAAASNVAHADQVQSKAHQRGSTEPAAAAATEQRQDMAGQGETKARTATQKAEQLSKAPANAFHTDSLIGRDVRLQADDERVGTITDLVIGEDGQVIAAVVGVGGLLGIGERSVAISWDALQRTEGSDADAYFTTSMTQESLRESPEYDRGDEESKDRDSEASMD